MENNKTGQSYDFSLALEAFENRQSKYKELIIDVPVMFAYY